jgi:alpha-glucosidase
MHTQNTMSPCHSRECFSARWTTRPGAMLNATQKDFAQIFDRPMSLGTRCHQLAMNVVFESPLQMLSDSPSNYMREPEAMEFPSAGPSTWDETRALGGRIGEYVAVARRSGQDWYVGAP